MGQDTITSFRDCFSTLKGLRVKRTRRHELPDILIIAVSAIICEADSWVGIAEFGQVKLKWFQSFLHLPDGIPSHDIFGRVLHLQSIG